ncbi:MAG: hypothetical protein SAK29_09715 [Scytonema sp. PMC 1069.18]|nr:hypothetical protein [Scytonema sp. PMC 1069.18]MEC4886562.1 hypothetical protein [Scytonema sp. PMC 1070.18]
MNYELGIMRRSLGCWVLILYILSNYRQPVRAEGSKELVSNGGYRPYIEWSNSTTASINRRTTMKVYVQAGETVYLGSSVANSYTPGQDIIYRSPFGTQNGSCDVNDTTKEGFIDTLAKEAAGPLPNTGGYIPCTFTAKETGVYEVEFHSPALNGDPPPRRANVAFPTDNSQKQGISAWDITVRDGAGTTKPGRVFANYVAMNMGGNAGNNGAPSDIALNSKLYIQTKDGYRYRTDMNGVDPFGFIFFANSRGFIDKTNNSTLYRSAGGATDNNLIFSGNVRVQRPDVPDTPTDITHLVFLNLPDLDALVYLGIPIAPLIPPAPSNFKFTGKLAGSGNQTPVGVGGYFSFGSTSTGTYQIIIDTDNNGIYDPSQDRVLQNPVSIGNNVVFWDGKNAQGIDSPALAGNAPYNAQITIRAGEYHFPMLDPENNPLGFKITMENPPAAFPYLLDKNGEPIGPTTVYYNDDSYTTADNTFVNLNPQGTQVASSPRNAAIGINSAGGEHEFRNTYGDLKGIDTWTYFPGEAVLTPLVVTATNQANVKGTKSVRFLTDTDSTGTVTVGDTVEYTITYSNLNPGNSNATNFVIKESLPSELTFVNALIKSKTNGNDIEIKPGYNGSGDLTTSGTLRVGDTITITITAIINNANNANPISNQASATFKTLDNSATTGTVLTDADSGGATANPPTVGHPFFQTADDGISSGNDPSKTDDDDPTFITVVSVSKPNVLLVKRITAINGSTITDGGDNLAAYIDDASNPYDDNNIESVFPPDTNKWLNPSSFLIGGIKGGNVKPGDELEWTIYFLSASETNAPNVLICDRIPDNTTFIPTAFNSNPPQATGGLSGADRGIVLNHNSSTVSLTSVQDSDKGQYFPPGVDPKTLYPTIECGGANTNGAIVVNLGDLPHATASGTPPTSYGFVRFRGKVK